MGKKVEFAVILLVGMVLLSACASGVRIKGMTAVPGQEVVLNGSLYKPEGNGPFPAVVLLHRCNGVREWDHAWASKLKSWGYVALILDSFSPRGIKETCTGGSRSFSLVDRALDAHSGKSYLAGLPFVDPKRIAVIGWSYGAGTALNAVKAETGDYLPPDRRDPFRAAIAFYPDCSQLRYLKLTAPLLILIGEKDDWTSARLCSANRPPEELSPLEVNVKIYPGAYHCFDCSGAKNFGGHQLSYDPKAASDSEEQVKAFLGKYLK